MKAGFVALLGRPNVGKSTLLNTLLGRKAAIISDKPQTTRTSILGTKTTPGGQIIFVDNPGIHKPLHNLNKRMMSFVYSSLETADLLCLLVDATLRFGHGDEFVIETLKRVSTPSFCLINKVDLIRKDRVLPIINRYKDLMDFKEIIPISALKGTNVDVLEEQICAYLPEAEKFWSDEDIPTQSQRFWLAEIIREKILAHVRQELPFVTAVYIDWMEDREMKAGDITKYIKASIFVEKDNHRKIVIGRQGQLIKTVGIQARQEMEQILGVKVYIDLQVRVRPKWRDSAKVLDLIEQQ